MFRFGTLETIRVPGLGALTVRLRNSESHVRTASGPDCHSYAVNKMEHGLPASRTSPMLLRLALLAALGPGSMSLRAEGIRLTDLSRLELRGVNAEIAVHNGKPALRLTEKEAGPIENNSALIRKVSFHNGTIDVEVAGAPSKGAAGTARGFIGVSFRVQADGSHFENIYIRPTNGRAYDQLRRNHSTQYVSMPGWPWERLREETPGVYESYADMVPGEWTRMRIVVNGTTASLFLGKAAQPCLIVHDLKLGDSEGSVALWIGPGTEGYFRNLKIY